MQYNPNIKFLATQRLRPDTIKSWVKWTEEGDRFHWCGTNQSCRSNNQYHVFKGSRFDKCFPDLSSRFKNSTNFTREEGATVYYDYYNQKLHELKEKYPDKIRIYDTYEALNNKQILTEFLQWAEIDQPYDLEASHDGVSKSHNTNQKKLKAIREKYANNQEVEKSSSRKKRSSKLVRKYKNSFAFEKCLQRRCRMISDKS